MNPSPVALVERHDLPTVLEAQEKLAALVERGDAEGLQEIQRQASAYQEYEVRRQAKAEADYFGRLKILAEAAIGAIDIRNQPRRHTSREGEPNGALVIGEHKISPDLRKRWRLLAVGEAQGLLLPALDAVADQPHRSVTTYNAVEELQRRGAGWVSSAPLRKRFKESDLHLKDLADRVDSDAATIGISLGLYPNHGYTSYHLRHDMAVRLAAALGVTKLEPAPRRQRGRPRRRRQTPPLRNLTGGRWDESYSRLRKALDEFAAIAGEDREWDDAYTHFYALEEIIGKAMKS